MRCSRSMPRRRTCPEVCGRVPAGYGRAARQRQRRTRAPRVRRCAARRPGAVTCPDPRAATLRREGEVAEMQPRRENPGLTLLELEEPVTRDAPHVGESID